MKVCEHKWALHSLTTIYDRDEGADEERAKTLLATLRCVRCGLKEHGIESPELPRVLEEKPIVNVAQWTSLLPYLAPGNVWFSGDVTQTINIHPTPVRVEPLFAPSDTHRKAGLAE